MTDNSESKINETGSLIGNKHSINFNTDHITCQIGLMSRYVLKLSTGHFCFADPYSNVLSTPTLYDLNSHNIFL